MRCINQISGAGVDLVHFLACMRNPLSNKKNSLTAKVFSLELTYAQTRV